MNNTPHIVISGNVHILPVLHGQLEFAQMVVEAFRGEKYNFVAIELPHSLEKLMLQAAKRLPQISVIRYRNRLEENVYYLIEPADPLFEAARLGIENGIDVRCIDLDVDDYPDHFELLPDAYAVTRIGHKKYYEAYLESAISKKCGPHDLRREAAMAARLTSLSEQGSVLCVCGMAHAQRIADLIGKSDADPLDRSARTEASIFNLHPESCREVLETWSYLGAAYERGRAITLGHKPADCDRNEDENPRVVNLFQRAEERKNLSGAAGEKPKHAESVAHDPLPIDRQHVLLDLYREAGERYHRITGDELRPYHLRIWLKFLRNWSLHHGRLQPILYQIIVGSRAAVDDNFAYEAYQVATLWPWQKEESEIPTQRLSLDDLHRSCERVRFRPRQIIRRLRAMAGRKKLGDHEEWLRGFDDPFSHCSHPPEDIALERFSTYVQKKARGILAEENKRVEPFSASMLDGIDMRETLRNWHEGKLYVQELRKGLGGVGSVVVIFDENRDRYPWEITWLGEVSDEGDMALFATHPLQQVVGPGICRAEYGGFLLSYPPGRMSDVWSDELFDGARTRAERLVMAGVDYCEHRLIAYVAKKPPSQEMKSWAARFGKKIVYLPVGQFSPDTLKKLRVFHVLFGKDKRQIAKDFIW